MNTQTRRAGRCARAKYLECAPATRTLRIVALASVALLARGWSAQAEVSMELVGQWGGHCESFALEGNLAGLVLDRHVVFVDVSKPTRPVYVGQTGLQPTSAIAMTGQFAYLADDGHLHIFDISNPASPFEAAVSNIPGCPHAILIVGQRAYIANCTAGLLILDLSDPLSPTVLGTYATGGHATRITVSGGYAFVGIGSGVAIVNIADPSNPVLVATYGTPDDPYGLDVQGDYLYVADSFGGLQIVDVSDPAQPTWVATWTTEPYEEIYGVAVAGTYAFVLDVYYLHVLDISDPAQPVEVFEGFAGGDCHQLLVTGNEVFVDSAWDGLTIFNIAEPTQPVQIGDFPSFAHIYDVDIVGPYAYAGTERGLQIIDITDPALPVRIGGADGIGLGMSVQVIAGRAYVAVGHSGVAILDVSEPTAPKWLGGCATPDFAYGIAVQGDYAYVSGDHFFAVVDVSQPDDPHIAGQFNVGDDGWDVAVAGDYAYVANDYSGLAIVDVSIPAAPILVATILGGTINYGVDVSRPYAFVVGSNLRIVDVSDPAAPVLVATYSSPSDGIDVAGDLALVECTLGADLLNVQFPTNPVRVARAQFGGWGWSNAWRLSHDLACGAYVELGLLVFALELPDRGDLNCDGQVDFGDINPTILALTDAAGYHAAFPDCNISNADVNLDGQVSLADINPFVQLLTEAMSES